MTTPFEDGVKLLQDHGHSKESAETTINSLIDGKAVAGLPQELLSQLEDVISGGVKVGARHSAEDRKAIRGIREHAKAIHAMSVELEPTDNDGEALPQKSMSLGDIQSAIYRAWSALHPNSDMAISNKDGWIVDVYPDEGMVIIDQNDKYFKIPYSLDANGEVAFGKDQIEVERKQSWIAVTKSVYLERLTAALKKIITKAEGDGDHPASHYLIVEDPEKSTTWHLRYKNLQGDIDHDLCGSSWAALTDPNGFRGNKYEGPGKQEAISKLKKIYADQGWNLPGEKPKKSIDVYETLVAFGSEIKALGDMPDGSIHLGGKLVRFSNPTDTDLTGDFFDDKTDYALQPGEKKSIDVYFHHALPMATKSGGKITVPQKIGKGEIWLGEKADPGVLIDAILFNREDYEKAISSQLDKVGWSSGTASHLVHRTPVGKAMHIDRWTLGDDASITPIPADYKNCVALKSLIPELSESDPAMRDIHSTQKSEVFTMEITDEKLTEIVTAAIDKALKAQQPPAQGITTILEKKQAPALVAEIGSDPDGMKAMRRFIRYGDISNDLKPEVGYKYYPSVDDGNGNMKVYNWTEGGTNDGYALVPPAFWKIIVEKRYEMSVMRAAGAQVMPCSSDKMMVPAEYTREAVFVKTTEATGASDQTSTEPVSQKEIDIFLYSRYIPVTVQLLQDSIYPVESFVASRLGHAAALTDNSLFMVGAGNGATDVEGVFIGGTAGKTLAAVAAIGQVEPVELFYTLPAQYQAEAVWFMRNATLGAIRSLTGSWFAYQPTPAGQTTGKGAGNVGGTSETLQYHNVWVTDYCAAIGSGNKSMIVGNPNYYGIAENQGMLIQRNPWDDAKHHIVNFYAYMRLGGAVLQSEAWSYATHPTA